MAAKQKARQRVPWENWQMVMITHTLSLEETDNWCESLAKEAGLEPDEVDWSSFAGRAVIKAVQDREKVISAVYLHLDKLRKMHQSAIEKMDLSDGYKEANHHIGMLLDEEGALIQQCSFRIRHDEKKVFGF